MPEGLPDGTKAAAVLLKLELPPAAVVMPIWIRVEAGLAATGRRVSVAVEVARGDFELELCVVWVFAAV